MPLLNAVETSREHNEPLAVDLTIRMSNGRLLADIGSARDSGIEQASLWLLRVAKSRPVAIGRGENRGRSVTYTNVVRSLDKIGEWSGVPTHFAIDESNLISPNTDGWVLLLQGGSPGKPGPILAAAKGGQI